MPLAPMPAPAWTIHDTLRAVRAGKLTCTEIVEQCLNQIDAREPIVQAWATLRRDEAIKQARRAHKAHRSGQFLGPLHGIPFGIKDIIDVADVPTKAGTTHTLAKPSIDAPVVAALRKAGAIILGKTVTTPYAWIDPPPTTNPWNPQRTPGGSSSGSAAALAAGMCLGALGSQTGGSLTRPASFCGVASLKPTFGRIPTIGVFPLAPSLDHVGPMARTAKDLALIWHALLPAEPLAARRKKPPRIGRVADLFQRFATPDAKSALALFLKRVRAAGAHTERVKLPPAFSPHSFHRVIMAAEAAAVHYFQSKNHPELYPPRISELIHEGDTINAPTYVIACEQRVKARTDLLAGFGSVDVLVTPAAPGPAPDRTTTGDPVMNAPWSFTGFPTVSIPVALSQDGLPLAVQLVGKPNHERALLEVAIWCESML